MPAKSNKKQERAAASAPPPAPASEPKAKAASKAPKGRPAAHKAAPVKVTESKSGSESEPDQDAESEESGSEEEVELPKPAPRGNKRQQEAVAAAQESDEDEDSSDDSDSDEDEEDEEDEEPVAVAATMLRGRGASSSSSAEMRGFLSMSQRMLAAGRAQSGNLSSKFVGAGAAGAGAGKGEGKQGAAFVVESTFRKSNPIEAAQASSNLYSTDGAGAGSLHKQREVRAKTLGKGWFDLAPAQLNEGLRADMKVVQMRNYLDPKRFYKNPDKMKHVIGVGTVVEGPEEFTTQRMTRKERKQSLVGEILADKSIKDYTKRKYGEIQKEKERNSRKKKKMGQRMGVGSGARKIRKLY